MFGLIIFGANPVKRKLGSGSFHCPTCGRDAPYDHYKARQFFTLYFIPVIPLGSANEFVRCAQCGSEYTADILLAGRDACRSAPSSWRCRRCGNTNPPEYSRCVACNQPKD